jgi:hypothetical protein
MKKTTSILSILLTAAASLSLQAAAPVPQNLAGGLDKLVESNLALKNAQASHKKTQTFASTDGKAYATQEAADFASTAITNGDGRIMVRAHLSGMVPFENVRTAVSQKISSLAITAVDKNYKGGVIEGYISVDDVPALAQAAGIRSVILELKPDLNRAEGVSARSNPDVVPGQTLTLLGTTFDQGVTQHRVDQINQFYNAGAASNYQGTGMSIGFISDSFGKTTVVTPATDVANNDLPGNAGNPAGNTTPVAVLQDAASGTDEGRAMVQIGYKMAPKAKLAFATANNGEVGFANNIRALAGLVGFTYPNQTFKADVVCDDVGYGDEPFFEDGIIGNAIDDVNAAGVSYFSSAGNDIGTYDYDSDYRNVPYTGGTTAADCTALVGTNINLASVPTNLYQGGFHNFNPNGLDVAQSVNVIATASLPQTNFQWDDPYNQTVTFNPAAIYTAGGSSDGTTVTPPSFTTPSLTAGQNYVITVTANVGSSFDAIVTIKDPSNNTIVNAQDTGTDETINLFPPTTGAYTIIVTIFGGTTGAFTVNVYNGTNPQLSTDFNLLVFNQAGGYLPASSLVTNNYATNVPFEFGKTARNGTEATVQYVIARASVPTSPTPATHIRYIIRGNGAAGIGPAEYFTYNTPNTKGHAMAKGCNGTAAYSVFRPSQPEYFTSPGPATVYFDKLGNRLTPPDVRLQPGVAAADAGNTSFFSGDSAADLDNTLNFSGTSAAAPHAAAIAALVIQAHGGAGSVTPAQMTNLLHRSAFPHDLDPNSATGSARTTTGGKVTININSDLGLNPSVGAKDPNSMSVSYVGPDSLASLVFNPAGTAATGGNVTGGNNGVDLTNTYFSNIYPGEVFEPLATAFTLGTSVGGLTAADVVAAFSNQAPLPSTAGQWWTMTLTFPNANFTGGKALRFTVGRGPQHNSSVQGTVVPGTGQTGGATSTSFVMADLFGGGVLIPDNTVITPGMAFSGTTTLGATFGGTIQNRIGNGYSVTDGFGFINAEVAVSAPIQ